MSKRPVAPLPQLTERPAWKALQAHYQAVSRLHMRELFADDPTRGERFAVEACGLYLDYSKNRITIETVNLLCQLAMACNLREHIEAMFTGKEINTTEQQAVLHTALRAPEDQSVLVDGVNVVSRSDSCRILTARTLPSRYAAASRKKPCLSSAPNPSRHVKR